MSGATESSLEARVVDANGADAGKLGLPDAFGQNARDHLLFEQVLAQLASRRAGTHATKTKGEVRGGGAKPWRQKGTGRARAGSSRSPIWRGGGTTFGPQPRSYAYRLPRSARRAALAGAVAQKVRDGEVTVIDGLSFPEPKTKRMREFLAAIGVERTALIVLAERDANVELSARNIPGVQVTSVDGLNVYDLLKFKDLLVAKEALAGIEDRLTR